MAEKPRINLTVDPDIPDLLEQLAGGRNSMGGYVSQLVRNMATGATAATEIEKLDRDGMKLMIQGLAGRVASLEGEVMLIQSKVVAIMAGQRA